VHIPENAQSEFVLRAAYPSEAQQLADLGRDTFVATFGHLYSPVNLDSFLRATYGSEVQAGQLTDSKYGIQVAVKDSRFVGYVKVGANSIPFAEPGRNTGELKQLYVRPDLFGSGLAPRLMEWGMTWLRSRGYQDILLSVFSQNLRAQRFYERYGFIKLADHFFMVGDHRDEEFIFRARLK
jgi:ribosomal protein S18 acetylase RimI-like enzyme